MNAKLIITCLMLTLPFLTHAQDPTRFEAQVEEYRAQDIEAGPGEYIVFTGSSSVRMWKDVDDAFPEHNVLNRGFGGSQFSDLLYYLDDLVLQYKPQKVFIYEGDNDVASGKKAGRILKDARKLRKRIHRELPGTEIYFISPKPSLARWELRDAYTEVNRKLEKFAAGKDNTYFVDVWTPMLDPDGKVMDDIFIEDGLHMNSKGYAIWAEVIGPYLR